MPISHARIGARLGSYEHSGFINSTKHVCTISSASAAEPVSRYANRNRSACSSSKIRRTSKRSHIPVITVSHEKESAGEKTFPPFKSGFRFERHLRCVAFRRH